MMCECQQRGGVLFNEIVPLEARIAEMTEHCPKSQNGTGFANSEQVE
jgi:hypothetical protein